MLFFRLIVSLICAVVGFFLTAVISDLVIVEILGVGQDRNARTIQQILITVSIPTGFATGWVYLSSTIRKKLGPLKTRASRLKAVGATLFCIYYLIIVGALIADPPTRWLRFLFNINYGALYVWTPILLLLIIKTFSWVMAGTKENESQKNN